MKKQNQCPIPGNPLPPEQVSLCPAGEAFTLPQKEDYKAEFQRLQEIVNEQRLLHREIVVVMGLGFVGAVMAGVIADSVDKETGESNKFVIGMQRPSTRSFWKIPYINRGIPPVEAEDPEVYELIRRCVLEKKTLTASFIHDALSLADVVVVDVQCDYHKESLGNVCVGKAEIAALEESLKIIVRKLTEMGGEVVVHDPYVKHWWEFEKQDTYPADGASWARFFRNQEKLSDLRITHNMAEVIKEADAVIFAVRHKPYKELSPEAVVEMAGKPLAVVDCFGLLDDAKIRRFLELGCEVKALGRGHIKRLKGEVLQKRSTPFE